MYPSEWKGSTNPNDESGIGTFMIEGVGYGLRLESFSDFKFVGEMLDAAFKQGKKFSARAMRSHIVGAMDDAERAHAL